MSDGRPRYVMEVQFQLNGAFYSILELDTDDNGKAISTLVVKKNNPKEWNENLEKVTKKVVVGSLTWPRKLLIKNNVVNFINHPTNLYASENFDRWVGRVIKKLLV